MYQEGHDERTLDEYRQMEVRLHLELTNTCRKYISHLGIVSIMGILDIVKQETVELERATRKDIEREQQTDPEESQGSLGKLV